MATAERETLSDLDGRCGRNPTVDDPAAGPGRAPRGAQRSAPRPRPPSRQQRASCCPRATASSSTASTRMLGPGRLRHRLCGHRREPRRQGRDQGVPAGGIRLPHAATTPSPARDDLDQEFYQSGLDSFLVEARTLATFRHRNIVRVARFFEANKTAYMVLEYERGQSLKAFRKSHENIPESDDRVAAGAAARRPRGGAQRGLPAPRHQARQHLRARRGRQPRAARLRRRAPDRHREEPRSASVVTPGYGPIEQYAGGGRQGPWTDIYSMGATLFWLVTRQEAPRCARRASTIPRRCPAAEALGRGPLQRGIPARHRLGAADAPGRPPAERRAVPLRALRLARGRAGPAGGASQDRRGRRIRRGRRELGHDAALAAPASRAACAGSCARSAARPPGPSR